MATREYYFNRATAEATATGTTMLTAATLSFTPVDNSSYAVFWSCRGRHGDLTTDLKVDLLQTVTSATMAAANLDFHDVTSNINFGGFALATFATATGNHKFNVRFGNETATSNSQLADSSLTALGLQTADQFREVLGAVTTTSTAAYQTVATFSFTPSASGDYLLLAAADWKAGATTTVFSSIQLDVGGTGTDYGMASNTCEDQTSFRSWMAGVKLAMTTSQWDMAIQVLGATTSLTASRNHRFLALRMDGFDTADYTEQRTLTVSTTTSSATVASLSATTAAHECLVIGTNVMGSGSNTEDFVGDFLEDGTVVNSDNEEINANNSVVPGMLSYTKAFTAAAHTFRWGVYGEFTSSFYRMDEAVIAVLDLQGTAVNAVIPQIVESYRRRRLY